MKRIAVIAVVLVAAVVLVVLAVGSSDSGGTYQVRAIFKNAFTVIPGEDVKVAGVKVGVIGSLDTTDLGHHAAVVLDIDKAGFQDFRQDASCTIRPQSLIGERFVECTPTQAHPVGDNPSPPLAKIKRGPGRGQHLLPVTNTVTPVDLDLIGNIMRLPYRQRFTIILNEFGIGLGARGGDLRRAIRSANPALLNLDKVLSILAKQNKVLADLAVNGDKVLTPLADDRKQFADFFKQANTVNEATAEHSQAFERNLQLLPQFLRQLTPTMKQLQSFSNQFTPVLNTLHGAAPSVNKLFENLAPLAAASTPAIQTLGTAADAGSTALVASYPLSKDLDSLGQTLVPTAQSLSDLLSSLKSSGGVGKLMDFIYYGVSATNGYDSFGHYLRAELLTNLCTDYTTVNDPICNANFKKTNGAVSRSVSARQAQATAQNTAAARASLTPASGPAAAGSTTTASARPAAGSKKTGAGGSSGAALKLPSSVLPDASADAPKPGAGAPAASGTSGSSSSSSDPDAPLLNYLLGNG